MMKCCSNGRAIAAAVQAWVRQVHGVDEVDDADAAAAYAGWKGGARGKSVRRKAL